ncbi:MAG TPA: 2-isopropylmalate synthase [Polyangiaceae bacterium]|jgi:2-isopropylmalate synthase
MPDKITIFDTTLRDGEQSAGVSFSKQDKLDIAGALEAMGVDVIEAGFPAASASEADAVSAVAAQIRDATVCGLSRCVAGDVDAAGEALKRAARSRIHLFLGTSDVHLQNQLRTDRATVLGLAQSMVARAKRYTNDIEFSPMDATRADPAFLAEIVRAALGAGATTINIPDTVGYALPAQIDACFRDLRARVPELEGATLSFHGQDDLGLSTANAIAAVTAGARQVELAVNGIGERAGNTSFEEVVMILKVHGPALGVRTDVDTRGIYALSKLVEERSGMPVAGNKAIVGGNAFRHASGIHQDGVIKHRQNYEIIDPAWIGHPKGTQIVLGKLSGRAGFAARVRELGWRASSDQLERAFGRFQILADTRREVSEADVASLCLAEGIERGADSKAS